MADGGWGCKSLWLSRVFVSRLVSMRNILALSLTVFVFLGTACSPAPEHQVAGARWLDAKTGGSMFDVLAYPITEDELIYFEAKLPLIEVAARKHEEVWNEISTAEDPSVSARENEIWEECGVLGSDIMAVTLKLDFLREYGSVDESVETDLRANVVWLEERMKGADASPELFETANVIRATLGVIEAHRSAGAFESYKKNAARYDAALDRFTSIGVQ